jgi:hypothetical protein
MAKEPKFLDTIKLVVYSDLISKMTEDADRARWQVQAAYYYKLMDKTRQDDLLKEIEAKSGKYREKLQGLLDELSERMTLDVGRDVNFSRHKQYFEDKLIKENPVLQLNESEMKQRSIEMQQKEDEKPKKGKTVKLKNK